MKYRPRHLAERYETAEEAGDAAFWAAIRNVPGPRAQPQQTTRGPGHQPPYEAHDTGEAKP